MRIACIVEGHGEVESLPVVIRRIAAETAPAMFVNVPQPIRMSRNKILQSGELSRALQLARAKSAGDNRILILLDADDDCPRERCEWIRQEAARVVPGTIVSAVMAKREFEAWFIAAVESIAGQCGLRQDVATPISPEDIRGAKEWLSDRMVSGRRYRSTIDQPAFASRFDVSTARSRAPSFGKLYRDIEALLFAAHGAGL